MWLPAKTRCQPAKRLFTFCKFMIYHLTAVMSASYAGEPAFSFTMAVGVYLSGNWYPRGGDTHSAKITNNDLHETEINDEKITIKAPPVTLRTEDRHNKGGRQTETALPNGEWNSRGCAALCGCAGALSSLWTRLPRVIPLPYIITGHTSECFVPESIKPQHYMSIRQNSLTRTHKKDLFSSISLYLYGASVVSFKWQPNPQKTRSVNQAKIDENSFYVLNFQSVISWWLIFMNV